MKFTLLQVEYVNVEIRKQIKLCELELDLKTAVCLCARVSFVRVCVCVSVRERACVCVCCHRRGGVSHDMYVVRVTSRGGSDQWGSERRGRVWL